MTVSELAQNVQFTVDGTGHVTAVVLAPEVWRRILAALEDSEDRQLIADLQLRLANGPRASGAIRFEDVTDEWQ